MITQHHTISSNDPILFDSRINKRLDDGWKLHGKTTIVMTHVGASNYTEVRYVQCMVKKEPL